MHAGCVARLTPQGWAGVLLCGPSGIGKSDLALRLMERGWALVADDRSVLWRSGGRLYAKAPPPLAHLIEVRGLDVMAAARREFAAVRLVIDCVPLGTELERVPERAVREFGGVEVEAVRLRPAEASAMARVELALRRAVADPCF
jgi:serine kinase of HPr protein (carbohydrate metabolism regulator)